MNPRPNVRPARATDVTAILSLMRLFNRGEGISWRPRRIEPALRRLLREPALGLVVVVEGTRPGSLSGYAVGTFGYDLEFAGPDAFLTELYIRPARRGRGDGRRLLEALLDGLRAGGAGAVTLLVWPRNGDARRLYERAGFAEVPRIVMMRSLVPRGQGV